MTIDYFWPDRSSVIRGDHKHRVWPQHLLRPRNQLADAPDWCHFCRCLFSFVFFVIIKNIINRQWAKIFLTVTPSTFLKLNITFQNSYFTPTVTTHFLLIALIAKTYQDRRPSHRTGGAKGSWFQHICLRPPPLAGDEDRVFIFRFMAQNTWSGEWAAL